MKYNGIYTVDTEDKIWAIDLDTGKMNVFSTLEEFEMVYNSNQNTFDKSGLYYETVEYTCGRI